MYWKSILQKTIAILLGSFDEIWINTHNSILRELTHVPEETKSAVSRILLVAHTRTRSTILNALNKAIDLIKEESDVR